MQLPAGWRPSFSLSLSLRDRRYTEHELWAAVIVAEHLMLMGKLLKYPVWFLSWLLRSVWVMALKPVVRFVVLRGKGGGELPGGSY